MPLYEYTCGKHSEERVYLRFEDAPKEITCSCGSPSHRCLSNPTFKLGWVPTVNDSGNVWEGTKLEGTDGVNQLHYKSDKIFVDHGTRKEPGAKSKKRRGMAAVLAGDAA